MAGVLAKDNGVSLSTIGPGATGENSAAEFATTQWSVVLTAQGESPDGARSARKTLPRLLAAALRLRATTGLQP